MRERAGDRSPSPFKYSPERDPLSSHAPPTAATFDNASTQAEILKVLKRLEGRIDNLEKGKSRLPIGSSIDSRILEILERLDRTTEPRTAEEAPSVIDLSGTFSSPASLDTSASSLGPVASTSSRNLLKKKESKKRKNLHKI